MLQFISLIQLFMFDMPSSLIFISPICHLGIFQFVLVFYDLQYISESDISVYSLMSVVVLGICKITIIFI